MRIFATPSDDSIIRQVLSGQRQQFGILVERHLSSVYAVAYAQTHNHADAEDIAQEAFLKAFTALDSLRDPRRFEGWIVTIARNLAHSLWQRRKREVTIADPPDNTVESLPDEVARREMQALLRQRIEGLEPLQREVLLLHYFAGRSVHEIASILDISSAATKKRLQRAREALSRDLLKAMEDAFDPPRFLPEQSKAILGAVLAGGAVAWEASGGAALAPLGVFATLSGLALKPATLALSAAVAITISIALWNSGGEIEAKQRPASPQIEAVSVAQPAPQPPGAPSDDAGSSPPLKADSPATVSEKEAAPEKTGDHPAPEEKAKAAYSDPEKALTQPVSIEFENIHIAQILEFASNSYDINLVLDQRAVAPHPLPADMKSTPPADVPPHLQYVTDGMVLDYNVKNQSLRDALTQLCEPLGLAYSAGPGFIWISTPEAIAADGPWGVAKGGREYDLESVLEAPVDLEFRDVHINEITGFIADSSNINMIWDWRVILPPVDTRPGAEPMNMEYPNTAVTGGMVPYIQLKDILWGDAFEALLRPLNLSYSIEEGFIWISSADRLQRERFTPLSRTGINPELTKILQSTSSVEFENLHLAHALAFLESESGLPVYVDTRVLTPSAPQLYELTCHELPIYILLNILTRECDLSYVVQGDRVMVSAPGRLLTREFPAECYVAAGEFARTALKNSVTTIPAQASVTLSVSPADPVLLDIQSVHGKCYAKIQTPSVERWYSAGEYFEQYIMLSIDTEARTCTIRDERRNIDLTLSMPAGAETGGNPAP